MLIHFFAGGAEIAAPLLQSSLDPVVKVTLYFCWHIVSFLLLIMTACFLVPFFRSDGRAFVLIATLFTWMIALWNVAYVLMDQLPFIYLPQWVLFVAIGVPATAYLLRTPSSSQA